jgi:hypothetical protein
MCDWFSPQTLVIPITEIVLRHIDAILICKLCDKDIKNNVVATCSSCEYHLGHAICVSKKEFQNCPMCFSIFHNK